MAIEPNILQSINTWLEQPVIDQQTKETIRALRASNEEELKDAFYRTLEFGTGGIRGVMGVGTNRMNKYTVGMATQGFANYLRSTYKDGAVKVAIAHDSRNNSRYFAETTAAVFAANGIEVLLFDSLRPTPELSFAIRHLNCHAGVVCTASHNPREYNGYKAYWKDGGQLVPPHDNNVIVEVNKIESLSDVKWSGNEQLIKSIGETVDQDYIDMVQGLSVYPDVIKQQQDLKIVYTPIHGTGITLVPRVLESFGFKNVHVVEEQAVPDGNFPTVVYPNPEESEAMSIGLALAKKIDADILLGTDPDADRVGIAIKDIDGEWMLVNGNQTAVLAFNYLIEARKSKGLAQPNDMVIKTIVTTDMIDRFAAANQIKCYNVLTGFKWIAELITEKEGVENYVIGGEESYGLMVGDEVRDKDAISAVALLCEMAAYEKQQGRSLFEKLLDLYVDHGFYLESLISITKKGMNGQSEIAAMMQAFRTNPPSTLNGSKVVQVLDYKTQEGRNFADNTSWTINLPQSNVLQFILEDGSKISARPSGTEPKIKFYFSVQEKLTDRAAYKEVLALLKNRIKGIIDSLGV